MTLHSKQSDSYVFSLECSGLIFDKGSTEPITYQFKVGEKTISFGMVVGLDSIVHCPLSDIVSISFSMVFAD